MLPNFKDGNLKPEALNTTLLISLRTLRALQLPVTMSNEQNVVAQVQKHISFFPLYQRRI